MLLVQRRTRCRLPVCDSDKTKVISEAGLKKGGERVCGCVQREKEGESEWNRGIKEEQQHEMREAR